MGASPRNFGSLGATLTSEYSSYHTGAAVSEDHSPMPSSEANATANAGEGEHYELRYWRRFIVWRYEGENKVPLDPRRGHKADERDQRIWLDYAGALEARLWLERADGIGFVLDNTPFCLVDLDDCIGEDGISEYAGRVLRALSGVEEVSVSGQGMHSLVRAEKPGTRCASKQPGQKIEIYDSGQFFVVADTAIVDQPIPERQSELAGDLPAGGGHEARTRCPGR